MTRSHLGAGVILALFAAATAAPPSAAPPAPSAPAAPPAPATAGTADAPTAGKQRPGKFEKQVTVTYKSDYLLYLPLDYGKEPEKKWPLIVFLHGSGERGNDLNAVKIHGPPKVVEKRYLPFVILSPQCPAGEWWRPESVMALTDEIIAKYKCDPDRVYLTGLSMGGFGVWETAIRYPDRFAAIAPICGGGNPFRAPELKNVPVWAFHGELDRAVPISQTAHMVAVLKQAGGNVRFTRYPQAEHDSWTVTYDNRELYSWFLEHKRGERK
jgi:predicted peptidase